MLVVGIIYTFALWLSFFVFFEDKKDAYTRGIFVTVIVLLCTLVAFRPIGSDHDSRTYVVIYNDLRQEFIEVSFAWIVNFVHWTFNDVRWVFIIYAILSVPLHGMGIQKLSPEILLSVLLWLSHYFLIQDFTQIRVAVATGFMMVGLPYLVNKQRLKYLLFAGLAVFAHYSAAAFLPFLFFSNKKMGKMGRIFLGGIVVFAYLLYFADVNLLTSMPIPYFQNKLDDYERLRDTGMLGETINVFNVVFLFRVCLFFLFLIKYERIVSHHPNVTILLKIYCLSLFSFVGLATIPIIAGRVCELYGIIEIVLFPMLLCLIRPVFVGRLFLVLFALGLLSMNIWYNKMLNFI